MISVDMEELLGGMVDESDFEGIVSGDRLTLEMKKPEDNGVRVYESIDVYDIIPKTGTHLGLDISQHSTGITVISHGSYSSFNHSLEILDSSERFLELLYRRQLKDFLKNEYEGCTFDTIVVEDAYAGVNPETTRLLYALNTAIDELIYDGYIDCKDFQRVNNKSWKSWLWSIEPQIGKGLDDKIRIQELLSYLGVEDSGKGYQDRLDSLGMLVGYFYKSRIKEEDLQKVTKVRWSDVQYTLVEDLNRLSLIPDNYKSLPLVVVDAGMKQITKEYIKYLLGIHKDSLVAIKTNKNLTIVKELLKLPEYLMGDLVVWRR